MDAPLVAMTERVFDGRMAADDLGGGLTAQRTETVCDVHFPHGRSGVRFERVRGVDGPWTRANLWFGGGRVSADVTIQPSAVLREIDQTAAEHTADPGGWRARVLRVLKTWDPSLEWLDNEPSSLLTAVGATTHPWLGEAYRRGHAPIGEVPRWASPVLRCHTPAAAAAELDPSATRRVARSLAASIVRHEAPATVDLRPLALAVMGVGLLGPDELANVLDAEHVGPPGGGALPEPDRVKEVRQMLAHYAPDRAAALLIDAATRHSISELADWLRQLWWVHERAPQPLPVRLTGVQDICRQLVPVLAPTDGRAAVAPVPAAAPPTPAARPATNFLHTRPEPRYDDPRMAPVVTDASAVTRWSIPSPLRSVNEFEREGIMFLVPTSRPELDRWGAVLHTCVGDYADPIIRGVSWVIGLKCENHLVGCIEVRARSRTVRQALGPRNQPLPPAMLQSALRTLEMHGIVQPGTA